MLSMTLLYYVFQSTLPIREETRLAHNASFVAAFQSTLPIREETWRSAFARSRRNHFNPLFPYGKRQPDRLQGQRSVPISIHSSHTGRDVCMGRGFFAPPISIHSSHTGRDWKQPVPKQPAVYFNPLFPYGKRPQYRGDVVLSDWISIHSSHTGRDTCVNASTAGVPISIHSSHTGRDRDYDDQLHGIKRFQSTLPIREETEAVSNLMQTGLFQSTLPIREETKNIWYYDCWITFQSTLPIREETANAYNLSAQKVVASAQHRLIFDSSLFFPAVQNCFLG